MKFESAVEEERRAAFRAHETIMERARAIVADRQANPRDPAKDITAALLALEFKGEPISPERVAATLRLLLSAGHSSTTSALGNTLLYLATHLAVQERLRADGDGIPMAIEELLRCEAPVQAMPRYAAKDTQLGERQIGAGDRVSLHWGSANRDERIFPDPDRYILDRRPNRHLTFGNGIHRCIGAPLARLEIRKAVEKLLKRTRRFEVSGDVERTRFQQIGVAALPVRLKV